MEKINPYANEGIIKAEELRKEQEKQQRKLDYLKSLGQLAVDDKK